MQAPNLAVPLYTLHSLHQIAVYTSTGILISFEQKIMKWPAIRNIKEVDTKGNIQNH